MKKNFILSVICTAIMFCSVALSACSAAPAHQEISVDTTARTRYDNRFGEENIPDQFENFGVGDPFVMRHNGKYYLYSSTKSRVYGYKCWESDDLIHWDYKGLFSLLNSDGTDPAEAEQPDQYLSTPYAPEVYYWDGSFYMVTSPFGRGHFIYKNDQPYGEFTAMSAERIDADQLYHHDGSIFIDDNEDMYFLVPGNPAVQVYKFSDFETLGTQGYSTTVNNISADTGGLAEGPQIVKVNGSYYMTYTGNFVESDGYRLCYSGISGDTLFENVSDIPANSIFALDSLGEQRGLGHCSTVLGPDLDSYYISYHSLDKNENGYFRQYNLNRVSYSKNRMSMNHADKGIQVPELAPFYVADDGSSYSSDRTDELVNQDGKILANASTDEVFTAEFNFRNAKTDGSSKLLLNDGSGDLYVAIESGNGLTEIVLKNGTQELAKGRLLSDFDFSALHTVIVAYADGHVSVKFDNLTKIDANIEISFTPGKIGYEGFAESDIGATAFSGYAFGSSDEAESYLVEGELFSDNFIRSASKFSGESGVIDVPYDDYDDYSAYSDTSALSLKTRGDYVTYKIDVLADGFYGIDALLNRASFGSTIGIQIDNGEPLSVTIPDIDFNGASNEFGASSDFVKTTIASLTLQQGVHTITLILGRGEFTSISLEFWQSSEYAPIFENSLAQEVVKGVRYYSQFALDDGAHYADMYSNKLAMFGTTRLSDYTVEVEINLLQLADDTNGRGAGIVLRLNNPNYPFNAPGSHYAAMQGYYVGFDKGDLVVERYHYGADLLASKQVDVPFGEYVTLKAVCYGNMITVYLNGEEQLKVVDSYAYTHGAVGLFSIGAEVCFRNLKISG